MADRLIAEVADEGQPLPGAQLPWEQWAEATIPHVLTAPLGARHRRLWEWGEALEPGVRPPAFVEAWPRGGAKSTTVEMVVVRLATTLKRRYALYVSATQDLADRHIQSVAIELERQGVERELNAYGTSRGWSRQQLRTANGFNLTGIGLDVAVRGVKLDRFRPDLIILDDIDDLHDTPAIVEAKLETLTRTLLPAGSSDLAVVYVQNVIHANSIMARIRDGRTALLSNRHPYREEPAVWGLQTQEWRDEAGQTRVRIVGGQASWEGQSIATCERMIEDMTIDAFLVESQHDTRAGGKLFWPEWSPMGSEGQEWHVTSPYPIPEWYPAVAGLDYGTRAPFCCLVGRIGPGAEVIVVGELYESNLSPAQQARLVRDYLGQLGLDYRRVPIFADPSMFPPSDPRDQVVPAEIEAFWEAGLRCQRASNGRIDGWANVREHLRSTVREVYYQQETSPDGRIQRLERVVPKLRVLRGMAPNLVRTIPLMVSDKRRPDDMDTALEDHALDALRYLIARPRGGEDPEEKLVRAAPGATLGAGLPKMFTGLGSGTSKKPW